MSAARQLRSPIQAATVETVVGCCGPPGCESARRSGSTTTDLDVSDSLLMVRNSKNGRSRIIPIDRIHSGRTLLIRGVHGIGFSRAGARTVCSFPRSDDGFAAATWAPPSRRWSTWRVSRARTTGAASVSGGLRHSFAVQSLLEWHHAGLDVGALLPRLSTYMGHVNPASTYWYLSASPELLQAAAGRLVSAAQQ